MVSKAWQELVDAERRIGREEGISEGADMLAKLLKALVPGSKEFDKALNATAKERMKLYIGFAESYIERINWYTDMINQNNEKLKGYYDQINSLL